VSWSQGYVGNAVEGLKVHIQCYWRLKKKASLKQYAKYTAIVQSSGTGKSRLVDEFAKINVVIHMNLREEHSTGKLMFEILVCGFLIHL
jgi:hypothetical protein